MLIAELRGVRAAPLKVAIAPEYTTAAPVEKVGVALCVPVADTIWYSANDCLVAVPNPAVPVVNNE
jgi:hypothetical protein